MATLRINTTAHDWHRARRVLVAGLLVVAGATAANADPPASQLTGMIDIVDFGTSIRTSPGGFVQIVGGRPNVIRDRLVQMGQPALWALRVDVLAGAPESGAGLLLPLLSKPVDISAAHPLDIAATPFLELRLIGELQGRRLRVALYADASDEPAGAGVTLKTLAATDLSVTEWRSVVARVPVGTTAGSLCLLLEGSEPCWLAVAGVRFRADDQPAEWTAPKSVDPHPLRQAMWLWTTERVLGDQAATGKMLDFCERHGITDLYCQVLYDYADDAVKLRQVDAQRAFNTEAHAGKLRVHALDGAPQYVLPENHARMYQLVAALDEFNRAGPAAARYDAIHLDNEPYILDAWKNPGIRRSVINAFVALNQELRRRANAANLEFGIDIPFWFDVAGKNGPEFVADTPGGRVPLLEALFRSAQNVGVMSYRQRVTGPNGVLAVCASEFELGTKHNVAVFASVELGTGKNVEDGTSFGVFPPAYCNEQLATLRHLLAFQAGCGGLAIHHFDAYEDMEARR